MDRGKQSLVTMTLRRARGQGAARLGHECALIMRIYGFHDERKRRYSILLADAAAHSGRVGTHSRHLLPSLQDSFTTGVTGHRPLGLLRLQLAHKAKYPENFFLCFGAITCVHRSCTSTVSTTNASAAITSRRGSSSAMSPTASQYAASRQTSAS